MLKDGRDIKQSLPFRKDVEIFRWGPIPGRYFYISEVSEVFYKAYPEIYKGPRWPSGLLLFKDNKMVWINDLDELRQAGKEVFLRYMVKRSVRDRIKKQWYKAVKKLSYFEKKIGDFFLEDLTDEQLLKLWKEFHRLIVNFWPHTVPAEFGNYGSDKLLEERLEKYITDKNELSFVMEVLTTVEKLSFYQQEEIDLVKTKDLEKHIKKYFWLRNSYNGVEEHKADFFMKKRKQLLSKNIKKLMEERLAGVKNKKKKIIKKYKLPRDIKNIADALCEGIVWQDERKKHIFIYTHYKELFLREVARRFDYNIDSLRNCSSLENMQLLEKRGVHMQIESRGSMFGFYMGPITEEVLGEDAKFCWEKYADLSTFRPL